MNVEEGIVKLQQRLPLAKRQAEMSGELIKLHQSLLRCFAEQGRPLSRDEIRDLLDAENVDAALKYLQKQDLVILDNAQRCVLGAYPFTTETTAHQVTINGNRIYAMCALDALSIAPMFGSTVEIQSRCAVTDKSIVINMHASSIVAVEPREPIYIAINWQTPQGQAAYSLCTKMVFLIGNTAIQQWQAHSATASVFNLADAVVLGEKFFLPLL